MSGVSKEDKEMQKKMNEQGFDPIVPGGAEEKIASRIEVKNQDHAEDVAKLLEDAAKFIRSGNGKVEAGGAFESKEILFKRLDLGDFVILSHRS